MRNEEFNIRTFNIAQRATIQHSTFNTQHSTLRSAQPFNTQHSTLNIHKMSVHIIYYKDGAKLMRPVANETEYRLARDTEHNRRADKHHMLQMNYSCLPNPDGSLKGTTRMSNSVGMDIDFDPKAPDYEERMKSVPELVMGKKDELGLLMLERSANKGYHIAFKRRPELSQEDNLKWASGLLGVEYDKGAKDITRVFFTPPTDRLLFVDSQLFENTEVNKKNTDSADSADSETQNKNQKNQKNPYSEKQEGMNTDSADAAEHSDSSLFTLHFPRILHFSLFTLHLNTSAFPTPTSSASGGRCTTTRRSLCAATAIPSPSSLPSTFATFAASTASCSTA